MVLQGGENHLELERARALLRTCLHHLQHEPPQSPEGQLHQLALEELSTLEQSLQQALRLQHGQLHPTTARTAQRRRRKK